MRARSRDETGQPVGFGRGPQLPPGAKLQALDAGRTQPERRLERRQRTDHPQLPAAAMAQGQQQQFQIRSQSLSRSAGGACDHADHLFGNDGEKVANRRTILLLPKLDENLGFELAPEQRTNACPGQAKRRVRFGIQTEREGIAERLADRAGVDLGAFGCDARAAPIAPMSE
ncbi:MAG TPA: hypothetical protein VF913_04855 [Xanthobacteraceae bacterium]